MKTKQFSCVALQHHGAEKIYKETKDLSITEELIYWQKPTNELQKKYQNRLASQTTLREEKT